MDKTTLTAQTRTLVGKKSKLLRQQGVLPAVVFARGKDSTPVTLPFKEFMKVYNQTGESGLIELNIDQGQKPLNVIVAGLDLNPVTGVPYHANLRQVSLTEKITTRVPITLMGESAIVKNGEGMVLHLLNELEVTCLPQDIPHEIEVDISVLENIDDALTVADLKIDRSKIEVEAEQEEMVVKIDYAIQPEEPEEITLDEATLVEGVEATAETTAKEGEENSTADTEKEE